jgi:hypothetical protein
MQTIVKGRADMQRFLAVAVVCGTLIVQMRVAGAQPEVASSSSALRSANPSGDIPGLPAAPRGKSTILGGAIQNIDPVRDEMTLKIFGQRPVKILFDERTQIYRDGKKIPLHDLGPADHASVQTLLDGTNVFALSVHILSQSPEGEYQGRVLNYDSGSNELTLSSAMFHEPVKLLVPASTPVGRVGQTAFSAAQLGSADLVKGALVSVTFASDKQGRGVARQISVLATPGSAFVFIGNISALDTHSGMLALVDPVDNKTYRIAFDSARFPVSQNLHPGDHVIVTADFDSGHYIASAITINN